MSAIILLLRVFEKQSKTQTTGEFKEECGTLTKDEPFIREVEAYAKSKGIIAQTETVSV